MKRRIWTVVGWLLAAWVAHAQNSGIYSWQGVLRDAQNKPVANQQVKLRFTFMQGNQVLYQEVHTAQTTELGLIGVWICQGTAVRGDCEGLAQAVAQQPTTLKIEVDPQGGNNFIDFGTQPVGAAIVSSFALKAGEALNDQVDDADADSTNELQTLSLQNGHMLTLSKGGGSVPIDPDTANELQQLSIQGNRLTISGGNTVIIPRAGSDADPDPNNEIQSLRKQGNEILLVPRGGKVTDEVDDADADPTNEIQTLSFSGTTLSISNGNSVDLKSLQKQPDTIWRESADKRTVIWEDDAKLVRYEMGINGYKHIQADGLHASAFRSNNVEHSIRWRNNDFPAGDFFKRSFEMFEHPNWLQTDYWMVNDGKYVELITTHPNNQQTAGAIVSQMIFRSKVGSNVLHNVLIQGAGTGAVFLLNPNNPSQAIAGMHVDQNTGKSRIFAQTKNFVEPHPLDPNKQIWYACIEGPEAAIYDRGTATLHDGEAFVPFNEHFRLLASQKYTVILTPLSGDSKGLAVVKKTSEGFYVKELFDGRGNYDFDWEVKAVRKGYEDYRPIRDRKELRVQMLSPTAVNEEK